MVEISQNFVAFSEYMNFKNMFGFVDLELVVGSGGQDYTLQKWVPYLNESIIHRSVLQTIVFFVVVDEFFKLSQWIYRSRMQFYKGFHENFASSQWRICVFHYKFKIKNSNRKTFDFWFPRSTKIQTFRRLSK